MNRKLILWTITVGLGGLLFGLDVAVISGAEQAIQSLWGLSNWMHGTAIAMALYGTTLGAAFGNWPANKYGRKPTLLAIGWIFLISSIGAALSQDVYVFMLFRMLGGLAIGASSVVAPVYIAEIAPPQHRGKMVITFQLNIVTGILLAYVSNYLFRGTGEDWRWMLGIVGAPSLLFTLLMYFTPESPRWLLLYKNDETQARKILETTGAPVDELIHNIHRATSTKTESLFGGKYTRLLLIAFLLAFFNQLSGINAIIYFAPRVFEMANLGTESAFLSTAGIGGINLLFTLLGWYLIDRVGRRTLMYIGSVGYILSLGLIAWSFHSGQTSMVPTYVFAFIASHAIGQGAVIWVFLSELFPNSVRAQGTSFGCLVHWLFAAAISQVFPFFTQYGGAQIFGFFCAMMFLQLLFVWKMMPETKGIALESMDTQILH